MYEDIDEPIMYVNGLVFKQTCRACPEQYDVFTPGAEGQTGYVRLRHGGLRADCPACGGTEVFYANPNGADGCFASDNQRTSYLAKIADAIKKHYSMKEVR